VEFQDGTLQFRDCLLLKSDRWNYFQAVFNNRGGHTNATVRDTAAFLKAFYLSALLFVQVPSLVNFPYLKYK
jgi:hypothetical protein